MLVRNQSWKYPVPVHSAEYWEDNGYDEDVATFLTKRSRALKDFTEKMRRGESPPIIPMVKVYISTGMRMTPYLTMMPAI